MSLQRTVSAIPGRRLVSNAALATLTLATLAACGGGGDSTPPASTVTSASVSAPRYGSAAIVTMSGTNLDSRGLSVSSSACINMTRLTSGPTTSTSTIAYYSCTVAGALTGTINIASNGVSLANPTFTVAAPQVSMAVTNGQGVNGNIVIDLYGDKAPVTVVNFLSYVNSGFYNGLIIHRNSPNFVIQGGGYGPSSNGVLPAPKATNAPIVYEAGGGSNLQWTVAMARTTGLNTATSQFFVNLVDNPSLDNPANPYAVFGKVTASSVAVVQAITAAPCVQDLNDLPPGDCLPSPNVVITSATQTQ
jgi:peptidyl-prolyl cis-trans isomerase A (cyclophilin A)